MKRYKQIMPGVYLFPGTEATLEQREAQEKSFKRIEEAYEKFYGVAQQSQAGTEALNSQA